MVIKPYIFSSHCIVTPVNHIFTDIFFHHKNIIKIVHKDTESLESSTKRSQAGVHIL